MTTPEPPPRKEMAKLLRLRLAKYGVIDYDGREETVDLAAYRSFWNEVIATLEADEKPLLQIEEAGDALLETGVIDPASLDVTKEILRKTLQAATSKTTGEAEVR